MKKLIDRIRKKVTTGELFKVNYHSIPVDFEMNQLKSVEMEEIEGLALRVIHQGKVGFSSTTSQKEIDGLIDKAIEISQFGQTASFDFPKQMMQPEKQGPELYDPAVPEITIPQMIETGNEMIKRIHSIRTDFRCDAGISRQEASIQYWNTYDASFEYRKTMFSLAVMIQDTREDDMMMLAESQQWGQADLSTDRLMERLEKKVNWGARIVEVTSGNVPAIFTPKALLVLLLPVISGLNGRLVNRKVSPLTDKKDQLLCSPQFSLYNDGTIAYAGGSGPYDDEGVPMQRFPLIEKGILKNFYYDLQHSGEAGVASTGNGFRAGFASSPSPGVSNLIIPEGKISLTEMIQDIDEGIIVDQVLGLGQGNVLSGAFSNNVQLGFKIKNGKVAGRIKNVMIAGNAFDILKEIVAVGHEARWVSGRYCFPPICVKSLSVSTKK